MATRNRAAIFIFWSILGLGLAIGLAHSMPSLMSRRYGRRRLVRMIPQIFIDWFVAQHEPESSPGIQIDGLL
jgi:hypothetical protein